VPYQFIFSKHRMNQTTQKPPTTSPNLRRLLAVTIGCALHAASLSNAHATAVITTAAGPSASDIQTNVNNFRTSIALGGGNNGVGGFFTNGFRNINWDGVPDGVADPNLMPGNFFNANSPRGLLLTTPGLGFLNSADSSNPTSSPIEFGTIDPSYPSVFKPFTAERLFIALGSTTTDGRFFVPTSPGTAASIFGFGVVFNDVDIFGSTSLEFFDLNGVSLGQFFAPVQNDGFSFLGVAFDQPVGSVRVTSGNAALGAGVLDGGGIDVVAMDDFMYSEPQAIVPEPGAAAFVLLGLGALTIRRHRGSLGGFQPMAGL
jgi:hypothetical protein